MYIISEEEVSSTWTLIPGYLFVDPVMTRFTGSLLGQGIKVI